MCAEHEKKRERSNLSDSGHQLRTCAPARALPDTLGKKIDMFLEVELNKYPKKNKRPHAHNVKWFASSHPSLSSTV